MKSISSILFMLVSIISQIAPAQPVDSTAVQQVFRQHINTLQHYLTVIASQNTPAADKKEAIEQTLALFEKGSTIQITSPKAPVQTLTYSLNEYLQNLSLLSYGRASFSFNEVRLKPITASDSSSQYMGSFRQVFSGQKAGQTYADITRKKMEVVLKPGQDPFDKNFNWLMLFKTVQISN